MSTKVAWLNQETWNIPADLGGAKGKQPAFKEESPAEPFIFMHIWLDFKNLLGGDATSYVELSAFSYGLAFQQDYESELTFSIVGDALPTIYKPYQLFAGAAPADSGILLRVGNFNTNDGRQLKMYVENFYFKLDGFGTAYTGGVARLSPVVWGA
jgi:hypothetical protein